MGNFHLFSKEDCEDLENCYGNNPHSPYGLAMIPKGVGEEDNFSKEWGKPLKVGKYENSPSWRLQKNEAVVIIGQSPPELKYWSSTNYLFSRFIENK